MTGNVLTDHGDYPGAIAKFNSELAIAREVGNRRAEASALNNMALVLNQQGDGEQARRMYEKALPVSREVSDKYNYATTLINIAGITMEEGDLSGARKTYDQALALYREINNQDGIASSLTAIGTVLDCEGDSAAAKKMLEQAMALDLAGGQTNPAIDKLIDMGDAMQHLGDLPELEKIMKTLSPWPALPGTKYGRLRSCRPGNLALKGADFTTARKDYEEALSLRNELGEKATIAATQVAIARLAIEEGHPGAAERPAREARDEFQQARKNDDQISATAVLAGALLAGGRREDAVKEVAKTAALAARSQNLSVQLAFAGARASVKRVLRTLPQPRPSSKKPWPRRRSRAMPVSSSNPALRLKRSR